MPENQFLVNGFTFSSREDKSAREQDLMAEFHLGREYRDLLQAHGAVYDLAERQFLVTPYLPGLTDGLSRPEIAGLGLRFLETRVSASSSELFERVFGQTLRVWAAEGRGAIGWTASLHMALRPPVRREGLCLRVRLTPLALDQQGQVWACHLGFIFEHAQNWRIPQARDRSGPRMRVLHPAQREFHPLHKDDHQLLELRVNGLSVARIAERLGRSRQAVSRKLECLLRDLGYTDYGILTTDWERLGTPLPWQP